MVKWPMASLSRSRIITDVYRRALNAIRDSAAATAGQMWRGVDPTSIDETLPPVLASVELVITVAQIQTATLAGVYMSAFSLSETGVDRPFSVDASLYAGRTQDGRPVRSVLALSSVSMKLAAGRGGSIPTIAAAGLARTVRTVRTEVISGARTAQRDMMGDDRVSGYYRVSSGDPCLACAGLAGQKSSTDDPFPIHGACRCTAEPIMAGVPDRLAPPDGNAVLNAQDPAQSAALYGDKAAAIKDGSVSLSDMVTIQEAPSWGPMLFETPLPSIGA